MKLADGQLLVMLVTSRETGKWVIPKGWPMRAKHNSKAARIEAFEEAGVKGRVRRSPVGRYRYWKRLKDGFALSRVTVYPLCVTRELSEWPECEERRRRWFKAFEAADAALEPELSTLILQVANDEKTRAFMQKCERELVLAS